MANNVSICQIILIFAPSQRICDKHIEEAFSAVPPVESGQFAGYRNRQDAPPLIDYILNRYMLSWV